MMRRWKLTDTQVEAILNMRLRALRKLEEIENQDRAQGVTAERKDLKNLLKDEPRRWKTIAGQIEDLKKEFPPSSPLAAAAPRSPMRRSRSRCRSKALVEREPVTVICSDKGWIRTMKGHLTPDSLGGSEVQGRRSCPVRIARAEHGQAGCCSAPNGRLLHIGDR
jgi:topoisomerase-4 subunit A